ncbi:hypothetical protein HK405_001559, partial [Cladochytrium tenue]
VAGHFSVDTAAVRSPAIEVLRARFAGGAAGQVGAADLSADYSSSKDKTFPVYTVPPAILFHNLWLAPGDIRTFKFEIQLPRTLPPSHRGKLVRFSYKFIVGVQRAGPPSLRSQVFQIPVRIMPKPDLRAFQLPLFDLTDPFFAGVDAARVSWIPPGKPRERRRMGLVSQKDDDEDLSMMQRITLICQSSPK